MDITTLLDTITSLIVAMVALAGLGGVSVVMVRRRSNGQTALPSSAHDETIEALNGIKHEVEALHSTVTSNNGSNRREHAEILDAVAPRVPRG